MKTLIKYPKVSEAQRKRFETMDVWNKGIKNEKDCICQTCGIKFKTPMWRWRDGRGKNCSMKCGNIYRGKNIAEIGKTNTGVVFTDEIRKKISQSNTGRKVSQATKDKLSLKLTGRKLTEETKEKMRQRVGEKSPAWKGGITPINMKIRSSLEYKLWRTAVFERDKYTCVWCGARNGRGKGVVLNADHIKPFAYYPELRFAIDNGRTLCVPCHRTTETYGGQSIKNIKKYNDRNK